MTGGVTKSSKHNLGVKHHHAMKKHLEVKEDIGCIGNKKRLHEGGNDMMDLKRRKIEEVTPKENSEKEKVAGDATNKT